MPIIIRDETASADAIYIADDGRIGINGQAVTGYALSYGNQGVIADDSRFKDGMCVSASAAPTTGQVVIPSSGTLTIPTGQTQPVVTYGTRTTDNSSGSITLSGPPGSTNYYYW